ncbi:DivIVA domain-containing protein [Solwaraspora sp. WMMD406]|uniref:DivIVA domain-containing protein n=1 Tax=Solwaraspora sp. WMMD406 TaxID=3016095 RepID=UPI0024179FFD|nr:DivIVA domain-containing protein [Solwaraspora sp. WMMD406]MDG4763287.1 DivIVA domain-containing protein [Solwaraspora sp. WMMD406]
MRRLLAFLLFPRRTRRQARVLADLAAQARPPVSRSRPPAGRGRNTAAHHYHGGARWPSISPGQVRDRQFPDRARRGRGYDPTEVRAFLHLVADELAAVRAELAMTRDENVRIKQALRDWQSRQFQARMPA